MFLEYSREKLVPSNKIRKLENKNSYEETWCITRAEKEKLMKSIR